MTQPSGQPSPTDDWRAVPPEETSVGSTPPMPGWVKPALAAVTAVLVLGAGLIGASLGSPGPAPSPEPSPSPTPTIALEPPVVVDDYVRGQSNNSAQPGIGDQKIVQADYSDAENTVVFVMTSPAADVRTLMEDAGVQRPTETAEGSGRFCGDSEVTGQAACGEVLEDVEDVGLLLVSVTDQSETTISNLLDRFKEELGQ